MRIPRSCVTLKKTQVVLEYKGDNININDELLKENEIFIIFFYIQTL